MRITDNEFAEIERVLLWLWDHSEPEPFDGISEMSGNMVIRKIWHCHGCNGEFVSKDFVPYVGYGDDPTDETFPHEKDCVYLLAKQLINDSRSNQ